MADTIFENLLYLIAGGIISLLTLLINWKIEKKRKRLNWRKDLIDECKKIISDNRFNPDMFRENSKYFTLKPYLSDSLKEEIEEKRYQPGKLMTQKEKEDLIMKEYSVKKKLLEEIGLLEKKWGLF